MKRIILALLALSLFNSVAPGKLLFTPANIFTIHEIRYYGRLADDEARFTLDIAAEASGAGENSVKLLEGDVAILPGKLPAALKIIRNGNRYLLVASHPGQFKFKLEVVAKIQRAEPWNQISFAGPVVTIAAITAQAEGADTEVQLLNGTLLDTAKTNGISRVNGFLGADQTVALRWQSKVTEVAHKTLLTVDSAIAAQLTPTVIKYTSKFHYEIVQGNAAQLTLALPAAQSLTRLEGEQVRDWHTTTDGDRQTLTVEFIKPVENSYVLTLYSEQAVDNATENPALNPPQPLNVERESGSLTISAEDTLVETAALTGLRQVNATGDALAAYQFNSRPFTLALKLKHIEPVISVTDRVTARLEETRLVIAHGLALNVEKAGIYTLELTPQQGFAVADVRGEGVDDWHFTDGKILVNFSARLLGSRRLDVQLESALKTFPEQISIAPLNVTGAAKETAQIGTASVPGIRLHTGSLTGLREIPVNRLPDRSDEILAYTAEQPNWKLSVASERLAARVVADVFNLVTIGDGLVGGSATIRYGLVNQGVQEFKIKVPAGCKNVEFTGPNIRRKEIFGGTSSTSPNIPADRSGTRGARPSETDTNYVIWTIGLQDKAWGGYTLVVTYDFQFDAKGATLPIGGVHAVDVERETGSVAITTAASLQLNAKPAKDTLRRVDEAELSAADRSLITRTVVLAYQYSGDQYDLSVDVKRYAEERVLEAVADRTQITSVLTESGQMLSQASFMVKNNEKQFQRFQLPADAKLWSSYVNDQAAKPERDGDWVLVPLPRDANRDQAFAVDIVYAQTNGALASLFGKPLKLDAPRTDIPNTYAEWQLFVPPSLRLSSFGGSMNIAEGTTYELLDAWEKFLAFYGQVLHEAGSAILFIGCLAFLVVALVISAVRRGWNGVITLLAVVAMLAVLGAMLLPALASAKRKAQRINSVNNLKEVGLAARIFAGDNGERLPASFDEMKNELGTDKVTYDTETGQRYTYLGGGMSVDSLKPESVLAYSPIFNGHCNVLFADGSVQQITADRFGELSQRGLVQVATPQEIAAQQQRAAIAGGQFADAPNSAPAAVSSINGTAGEFHGGFGGAVTGLPAAPPAVSTIAGIRSLRIELPQTGQPFLFTKVLNVRDEPLSIRARIMTLHTFQSIQMAWQSAAFLLGFVVWGWQWRREHRNTFILTVALALIIGSVCSLLIQWRALHDALIVGFPVVTLAVIAWLVWKYWPRASGPEFATEPPTPESSAPTMGVPPVVAAIALLFALSFNSATAADSEVTNQQPATANASIVSASYSGTVNDRVALLNVTLQFSTATAGQIVSLFGDDVAVQQFSVKNGRAELVREDGDIAVRFDTKGSVTLQIKMLVKIAGDVTKRRLAFAIPPALSSQVALALDETEADVDFPAAISFKRILDKDQTRVEAVMGSADRVEVLWTPRVKQAAEVAATVFCQNAALVTFGGGVVNVRATLDYQITQGELRQARVQLPAGQKLLRVEGQEIRAWEIKNENGAQVLVVDLLKGVPLGWRLVIETEKVLDTLPANVAVETPHAFDVKRENGLIALRGAEELALSAELTSGLERTDAGDFQRIITNTATNLASVFRFANPGFVLRIRAEAIQPEIESVARNNFRVGTEQVSLSAVIDYTIKRAGVFTLRVALPDGYRVERVNGTNILQQAEHNDGGLRILEVTLKERTSGAYSLGIELAHDFKELPKLLAVAGVHPLDTAKLTGFVAVSAEPGVAVKTETFDGLTEIPAVSLPDYATVVSAGNLLAYKFISSAPKSAPEWKLTVATENVAAWMRAEIINTFALTETLVNGRALVRYDIANAPAKELRMRLPAAFTNVEITGANIRSREQDGDVWRVELQSPVRGSYILTVTWDEPGAEKNRPLELTGISADGVERETGLLAISAKAPLQVSESSAADLQRVDAGDFPDWAGNPDNAMALAYRYVRPGYKLALDVRRFDEAEVLQALVDSAQFTSVVADDGQMMTEMSLSVRNNGRQFLEVTLPAGANVWSAFVAGQPVRPSLRDGKLLLPIQQSSADDGVVAVELTYAGTNTFPHGRGNIGFASPQFDVPLKNGRWEVYLPPDYDYRDFSGSMMREVASVVETASSSFSILDYSRMEQVKKASAKVEVDRDVNEARRQLAEGNTRVATESFNRAKANFSADKDTGDVVKKLESDLQTAQASNLINAQNDFTVRNDGVAAAGTDTDGRNAGVNLLYDNAAAGEQWQKLQQAQEIVTTKVQPLRVNLPLRGQHFEFTQVLQTEGGQPMTIRLFAASTKAVSWPLRGLIVTGTFLILWTMVTLLSRLTLRANRD
jgi:prepilin-type processing-associated H-X9-DG protein